MSEDRNAWQRDFLRRLRALAPGTKGKDWDRATLARLRHGLGKDAAFLLYRAGWLFAGVPDPALEDAALVASLFASYPDSGRDSSLGAALRPLRQSESVAKRFAALVDSHREDLPGRLRQVVSLLKANNCPLGWGLLLEHLRGWDHESRWVQKRWSRDFWEEDRADRADRPEAETVSPSISVNT
jgi:CRISPR type I-E-associated protein CasB/Cse2